ncbi:MAG: enoyl-CoA hydratase/isomerase family protein [Alphaproteobacteria bacterium]
MILTGVGDWMASIDFASFGDVGDPDIWAKVHDEGTQALENLANIRVPMIAAIEGKAWVHTEYALLANLIVAGEGATFNDAPHFAGGIVPGDGIFTTWSYYAGPAKAQAFLLDPQPITAAEAEDWGVVAEVVPDGAAVERAREIAHEMIENRPPLTLRNTRIHFIQPLKERIVKEVGYGLALEGASAAALVKQLSAEH